MTRLHSPDTQSFNKFLCLIAGVESFDAQFAEENHHDATNCGFLRGFHSENTRRATSRSLAHEQHGENRQRATQACDAYNLTLTLAQVRTTKERLKPVMVALNDACHVMRQRAIKDNQNWPANVTPIPVGGAKKKTGSVRGSVPSQRHHPTSNPPRGASHPVGRGWRLGTSCLWREHNIVSFAQSFPIFCGKTFSFCSAPIWLLCHLTYYHYWCAD